MASRAALITGGGTGIGAATALQLAAGGFAVAVTGRRPEPLEAVASELRDTGADALAIPADASDPADADRCVAATIEAFGGLDALVCSHGIGASAPAGDDTPDAWDATLRINLTGAFLVARAALPHLVARRGSVVMVSSTNALQAGPGWASYGVSKAGMTALAQSIANDYGPSGVRANAVLPGWVRTPMGDEDMAAVAEHWAGATTDDAYALVSRHTPLRRPADPEEVAAVIAFLVSPAAAYVTGAAIPVDGGDLIVDATSTVFHGPDPVTRRLLTDQQDW